MVKKKKRSRGVDAMDDDAPAVVETAPVPNGVGGQEAMDTADDDAVEPTGAELDLLSSKKKRKKRGLKLNGLQIQGLGMKKEPQKRKAVNKRKEKSIERALLNMDKQQEKLQKDEGTHTESPGGLQAPNNEDARQEIEKMVKKKKKKSRGVDAMDDDVPAIHC